jgi:hypothetical protein
VDGYRFRDIVSVRSATAFAAGSETGDGSYNASITVTVEGLNVLDVITAERITARLASQHPSNDRDPVITAVGSEFRGLRIGGHDVDVDVVGELCEKREYDHFQKQAGGKGVAGCSLFKPRNPAPAGLEFDGESIHVPSVGRIFLGEMLVSRYARRLTMLRVELGSPFGGRFEAASGEVNGSTYP